MEDWQLLRQFIDQGSQAAFAQLVERHRGFVYSTCRRELGDGALAEDATQAVFLVLARKAKSLRREVVLSGWLFQAARYAARDLRKSEQRRRTYEEKAGIEMRQETARQEELWTEIDPWLHHSLDCLGPKDREAILLRFFEDNSFAEVASALGQKEDAARHRVNRALGKMRRALSSHGVVVPIDTLGALLAVNALEPASDFDPAPSVGSPTPAGVPAGPELVGPRLYQLTQGVLRTMWMKQLGGMATALVIGLILLGAGAGLVRALTPKASLPHTPSVKAAGGPVTVGPAVVPAPKPLPISEIRITGNKLVPTQAILAVLGFKKGDTVDDTRVGKALTHVYNLTWFGTVGPSRLEPTVNGKYILSLPVQEISGLEGMRPADFQQQAEIAAVYGAAEDALLDHQPDKFAALFTPNFLATDTEGRQETREPYLSQFDGPLGPTALIEAGHYIHSITASRRGGDAIASVTVSWYRWTQLPGSPDTGCEKLEQSVEDDWHPSGNGWVLATRKAVSGVTVTKNPALYIRLLKNRAARGG